MPAHAYSNNRAHGSIFGTWFPFRNSYRNERLDDLDYENFSQSIFAARLRVRIELYFHFDWEKRKPNSLAYFFQ